MPVFLTIDGTTLELAGDQNVGEISELIRKGAIDGNEEFRTVILQAARADIPSSLPTTVFIKTPNITWFSVEERENRSGVVW